MEEKAAALEFLMSHRSDVLSFVSGDGKPHGGTVFYKGEKDFTLYFLTLPQGRKYQTLKEHPAVAFTISTVEKPQTLEIEGVAEEVTDEEEAKTHLPGLVEALASNPNYPAPITKLEPSGTVLMRIVPQHVKFADYASGKQGDEVFTTIEF